MTGRSHAQRARDAKLKGSSSCKCAMFCIVDVGALPEIPVMFFWARPKEKQLTVNRLHIHTYRISLIDS